MTPRQMSLAVVGADFPNRRGPTRRFEIALCLPGETAQLIPEPKNPADPHAVAVFSGRGVQIGYVTAERAPLVGTWLARGRIAGVIFQEQTQWGAIVRIGLDGEVPILPAPVTTSPSPEEDGFWPDEIPPDDWD